MINKENKEEIEKVYTDADKGIIDTARMEVQCHIIIKDKDTNQVLINKRG